MTKKELIEELKLINKLGNYDSMKNSIDRLVYNLEHSKPEPDLECKKDCVYYSEDYVCVESCIRKSRKDCYQALRKGRGK